MIYQPIYRLRYARSLKCLTLNLTWGTQMCVFFYFPITRACGCIRSISSRDVFFMRNKERYERYSIFTIIDSYDIYYCNMISNHIFNCNTCNLITKYCKQIFKREQVWINLNQILQQREDITYGELKIKKNWWRIQVILLKKNRFQNFVCAYILELIKPYETSINFFSIAFYAPIYNKPF